MPLARRTLPRAALMLAVLGLASGCGLADQLRTPTEIVYVTVTAPPQPPSAALPAETTPPLPQATLEVFSDGCGVIRSELGAETPDSLGWSVTDQDGFEVLSRRATGETHYRYFQGGTYSVVLTAHDGRNYVPVSNTVTITC